MTTKTMNMRTQLTMPAATQETRSKARKVIRISSNKCIIRSQSRQQMVMMMKMRTMETTKNMVTKRSRSTIRYLKSREVHVPRVAAHSLPLTNNNEHT